MPVHSALNNTRDTDRTMTNEVRAWAADAPGVPLRAIRQAEPRPGPGKVRIRVAACGLNFADTLMLAGRYQEQPDPPIIPGMEVCGVVDALGTRVSALAVGQRVTAYVGHGGLAEALCVPVESCIALPDRIGDVDGAAFQIAYGTTHLALTHRAHLQPGERLVVTGAAGGTGLAAVQIGAQLGAEVIAIARGAAKRAVAQDAGAAHTFDAESADLREEIRAIGGVAVGLDTVGAPLWDTLLSAANPEARLFPLGFAGGRVPLIKANHLLVKNLTVIGFYWGGYQRFAPQVLTESLQQVLAWMEAGDLKVPVGARYPFTEADRALEALRDGTAAGKIVVTMPA